MSDDQPRAMPQCPVPAVPEPQPALIIRWDLTVAELTDLVRRMKAATRTNRVQLSR